jgi:rhamnose utilization protein RhaD (predicted bifunctional aldolase and dehydrogenase)
MKVDRSSLARYYASHSDLQNFATRGVLTPEHIIRTKRVPLVIENDDLEAAVQQYVESYIAYFEQFASDEICLNPAPNYAVIKNYGVVTFGKNDKECSVMGDIVEHTMKAVLRADKLGGYRSISLKDSFDMEYWELEQAKLK